MLTVRLTSEEEKALEEYSKSMNRNKSDIVKEAITAYINRTNSSFKLGQDLFAATHHGEQDLSSTYKARLKQKLNDKFTH